MKRKNDLKLDLKQEQPPSGGCVLKRTLLTRYWKKSKAAAFGRLCVETVDFKNADDFVEAAAFGRLCVETK